MRWSLMMVMSCRSDRRASRTTPQGPALRTHYAALTRSATPRHPRHPQVVSWLYQKAGKTDPLTHTKQMAGSQRSGRSIRCALGYAQKGKVRYHSISLHVARNRRSPSRCNGSISQCFERITSFQITIEALGKNLKILLIEPLQ